MVSSNVKPEHDAVNWDADLQAEIERLRVELTDLHAEILRWGLVDWTGGSDSTCVPGVDLMIIKPSGLSYDDLTPESMVVCDLYGNVVQGEHAPSSATDSHAYVYRHIPEVGRVVHTHSTYACAWAARGESVPCVLTAMGDEFGAEIPIAPCALIGSEDMGKGSVETLRDHRARAVIMQNHGPFTIGKNAKDAVKAAVMCEDAARTVHISRSSVIPFRSRRNTSMLYSIAIKTCMAKPHKENCHEYQRT